MENIDQYKKVGADGYGMAGALFDKKLIEIYCKVKKLYSKNVTEF